MFLTDIIIINIHLDTSTVIHTIWHIQRHRRFLCRRIRRSIRTLLRTAGKRSNTGRRFMRLMDYPTSRAKEDWLTTEFAWFMARSTTPIASRLPMSLKYTPVAGDCRSRHWRLVWEFRAALIWQGLDSYCWRSLFRDKEQGMAFLIWGWEMYGDTYCNVGTYISGSVLDSMISTRRIRVSIHGTRFAADSRLLAAEIITEIISCLLVLLLHWNPPLLVSSALLKPRFCFSHYRCSLFYYLNFVLIIVPPPIVVKPRYCFLPVDRCEGYCSLMLRDWST